MPRVKLTDAKIRALEPAPEGRRRRIWDTEVKELVVVVTDKGTKSLMVCTRVPGGKRPVRRLIAHHPSCLIEQARTEAREFLATCRKGLDPREERRKTERKTAVSKENRFGHVAGLWVESHVSKMRQGHEYKRILNRELLPAWKDHPIDSIDRNTIVRKLQEFGTRSASGWNVWGVIRSFFSYAVAGPYGLEISPLETSPRIRPAKILGRRRQRDRQHSDLEFRGYIKAANDLPVPYGPYYLCLAYCCQRVPELSGAEWSEFSDLDGPSPTWTIPKERDKMGKERKLPLSRQLVEQLKRLPRYRKGNKVFAANGSFGEKPINSFTWSGRHLKKKWAAHMLAEDEDADTEALPTLHDIRRTARSRAPALGISFECAELMLGHVLPGTTVTRTYLRYSFEKELRAAMQVWADEVDRIASGGVVVPFPKEYRR